MSIPLTAFLLVWLGFLCIYAIMVFITVIQMIRLGMASFGTYASTILFLTVLTILAISLTGFFLSVDWSASFHIGASPLNVLQ